MFVLYTMIVLPCEKHERLTVNVHTWLLCQTSSVNAGQHCRILITFIATVIAVVIAVVAFDIVVVHQLIYYLQYLLLWKKRC